MADPYYPHTVLRALFLALVVFLSTLGLAVVLVLQFWPREITSELMLNPAVYAVIFAGGQFLLRGFRVRRLEDWGRIPRERVQGLENMGQIAPCRASRGVDTTGGPGRM